MTISFLTTLDHAADDMEHFRSNVALMTRYMLWHGIRCEQSWRRTLRCQLGSIYPVTSTHRSTPMMAVRGCSKSVLQPLLDDVNCKSTETLGTKASRDGKGLMDLVISIWNSPSSCTVSGHPSLLLALRTKLAELYIDGLNELQVATSSSIKSKFVRVSCPFHHPALSDVSQTILNDMERLGLFRNHPVKWGIPVYDTQTGDNISGSGFDVEALWRRIVQVYIHCAAFLVCL